MTAAPGLVTPRLVLRALSASDAGELLAGTAAPGHRWARDYPAVADVVAASAYLWAAEHVGEHAPWGPYQLVRRSDGSVIGGAGFHGPPVAGEVEIAYAVVPSARGLGYASEAAGALVALAAGLGVASVRAEVAGGNLASQRVALAAGLSGGPAADGSVCFTRELATTTGDRRRHRQRGASGCLGPADLPR